MFFLDFRSQIDIELHVKKVDNRGFRIKIENSGYNLADFDPFKCERLADLKTVKFQELDDTVYGVELTSDKIVGILDTKCFAGSTNRYTLPPGLYEASSFNSMLNALLPDEVKRNNSIEKKILLARQKGFF